MARLFRSRHGRWPRRYLLPLALLAWLWSPPAGAVEIRVDRSLPAVGEAVRIELLGLGEVRGEAALWVHRLPGSRLVDSWKLEPELSGGSLPESLPWRPERPGLVRLEVRGPQGQTLAQRDLAVCFSGPPPAALAVLLLAGGLLFTGAVLGLRRL